MSIHERSVMYMRQLETLLKGDLAHIDLRSLRSQSTGTISEDTAMSWKNVLAVTAPTLVSLDKEIDAIEDFVKNRERALLRIKRVLLVIKAFILMISYIVLIRIYSNPLSAVEMQMRNHVFAGTVIFLVIFMNMLLGVWSVTLDESFTSAKAQIQLPVHESLKAFKTHVSSRLVVKIMGHITSGKDPLEEFKNKVEEEINAVKDSVLDCPKEEKPKQTCETAGIDACSEDAKTLMTYASIHVFIRKYCSTILRDMADYLISVKEDGVMQYDQRALWSCVDNGVNSVQQLIQSQYDNSSEIMHMDQTIALEVVRSQVVMAFKINTSIVENLVLTNSATSPIADWTPVPGVPRDRQEAFSLCRANKACTAAYYHSDTNKCYFTTRAEDNLPGISFDEKGVGTDSMLVMLDKNPSLVLGGSANSVVTTNSARGSAGEGISKMMRIDSTRIVDKLMSIVKKYRFQIDILSFRANIESDLRSFYGTDIYDPNISAEVNIILEFLKQQVKSEQTIKANVTYLQPDRVIEKVRAMPENEIETNRINFEKLNSCTVSYVTMFPQVGSKWHEKVASIVTMSGNIALTIGFMLYIMIVYSKTKHLRIFKLGQMIQRCMFVFCIYSIVLVVIETMLSKMVNKREHNQHRIEENGEMLRRATGEFGVQFLALVEATRQKNDPLNASIAASTLIAHGKLVVTKYEQCNTVKSGAIRMPAPLSECLLYTVVAAIFITLAVIIINSVSFGERVSNIRMLKALSRRIDKGDASALVEAHNIIGCAKPNPEVWDLFKWFGIVSLATLTGWFIVSSQNVASDYAVSLRLKDDCEP